MSARPPPYAFQQGAANHAISDPQQSKKSPSLPGIKLRNGFFHAMFSYRVKPDQDFVSSVHHMINLLCSAGVASQEVSQDSYPWPAAFHRHESTKASCVRLFQDEFCLKSGQSWKGDGSAASGGFVGALPLSVVFVPFLSFWEGGDKNAVGDANATGSIGQMLNLSGDTPDNVLFELTLARELHLQPKGDSGLFPCVSILPLFMAKNQASMFDAIARLPQLVCKPDHKRALAALQTMGLQPSKQLKDGTLTVMETVNFFKEFQGVMLWDRGSDKFQVEAAAKEIIRVIRDSVAEIEFHDIDRNCSQMSELDSFLCHRNISYFSSIMASHKITSVYGLSRLKEANSSGILRLLAERGAQACAQSTVASELVKLQFAVDAAVLSPLAKSLDKRFRSFIDRDASFVTAMSSSCAFDILLSKKTTLVVIGTASFSATISSLINCFHNDQLAFGYDEHSFFPGIPSMISVYYGSSAAAFAVTFLAMLVAHFRSPRHGRYVLAFSLFMFTFLYGAILFLAIHSAIYYDCKHCATITPAVAAKHSVALSILNQPWHAVAFAACTVFLLVKQNWFVPVCLSVLILETLVPWIVLTAASVKQTPPPGAVFVWISIYVVLRFLSHIGKRRGGEILQTNEAMINTQFSGSSKWEQLKSFGKSKEPGDDDHPGRSSFLARFRQQKHERRETLNQLKSFRASFFTKHVSFGGSRPGIPMIERGGETILEANDLHGHGSSDGPNRLSSARFNLVLPAFDVLGVVGRNTIYQSYETFDSMIADAEFINYPFQEWVSSWLANSPDQDLQKLYDQMRIYFFEAAPDAAESVDFPQSDFMSMFEGGPFSGALYRGPVKHVDRAIAKVFLPLFGSVIIEFLSWLSHELLCTHSRLLSQAYRSYGGDFRRLTDVVRCSVVLDTEKDIMRFVKVLLTPV